MAEKLDVLSQVEESIAEKIRKVWPACSIVDINDDSTIANVTRSPAANVAVLSGTIGRGGTMNSIQLDLKVSVVVMLKHKQNEKALRRAAYPVLILLIQVLTGHDLSALGETVHDGDFDELKAGGWKTIAETKTGIAFQLMFDTSVELEITGISDEDAAELLEIFNTFLSDGVELVRDEVEL